LCPCLIQTQQLTPSLDGLEVRLHTLGRKEREEEEEEEEEQWFSSVKVTMMWMRG